MIDPLETITNLLVEDHGIRWAKLLPSARLWHDLGVDGDDASELFQRLHEWYGTDFSPLNRQWGVFFNQEGESLRAILLTMLLLIPSTALTLWITLPLKLSAGIAGIIGVATFFTLRIALGYLMPGKSKRPNYNRRLGRGGSGGRVAGRPHKRQLTGSKHSRFIGKNGADQKVSQHTGRYRTFHVLWQTRPTKCPRSGVRQLPTNSNPFVVDARMSSHAETRHPSEVKPPNICAPGTWTVRFTAIPPATNP